MIKWFEQEYPHYRGSLGRVEIIKVKVCCVSRDERKHNIYGQYFN